MNPVTMEEANLASLENLVEELTTARDQLKAEVDKKRRDVLIAAVNSDAESLGVDDFRWRGRPGGTSLHGIPYSDKAKQWGSNLLNFSKVPFLERREFLKYQVDPYSGDISIISGIQESPERVQEAFLTLLREIAEAQAFKELPAYCFETAKTEIERKLKGLKQDTEYHQKASRYLDQVLNIINPSPEPTDWKSQPWRELLENPQQPLPTTLIFPSYRKGSLRRVYIGHEDRAANLAIMGSLAPFKETDPSSSPSIAIYREGENRRHCHLIWDTRNNKSYTGEPTNA